MISYRFHFLNEETVMLTEAEFAQFQQALANDPKMEFFVVTDWSKGLQLHNLTYYEAIEQVVGEGKVVKPLTPAELREEKAAMATTTPTDLGHQLDHPDLGKNE